jgi:hypothetical protein
VRETVFGGTLYVAAIALATIYLFALLPVASLGVVANADYTSLECPGAMQCSDAASVRTFALLYVLSAPLVWLLFKWLRAAARAFRTEEDA